MIRMGAIHACTSSSLDLVHQNYWIQIPTRVIEDAADIMPREWPALKVLVYDYDIIEREGVASASPNDSESAVEHDPLLAFNPQKVELISALGKQHIIHISNPEIITDFTSLLNHDYSIFLDVPQTQRKRFLILRSPSSTVVNAIRIVQGISTPLNDMVLSWNRDVIFWLKLILRGIRSSCSCTSKTIPTKISANWGALRFEGGMRVTRQTHIQLRHEIQKISGGIDLAHWNRDMNFKHRALETA